MLERKQEGHKTFPHHLNLLLDLVQNFNLDLYKLEAW